MIFFRYKMFQYSRALSADIIGHLWTIMQPIQKANFYPLKRWDIKNKRWAEYYFKL